MYTITGAILELSHGCAHLPPTSLLDTFIWLPTVQSKSFVKNCIHCILYKTWPKISR